MHAYGANVQDPAAEQFFESFLNNPEIILPWFYAIAIILALAIVVAPIVGKAFARDRGDKA